MATRKTNEGLDGTVKRVFSRHRSWQALGLIAGTLDASERHSAKTDVAAEKMLASVLAAADRYFQMQVLDDIVERLQFRQVQELEKIYRDVRSRKIGTRAEQIDAIDRRLHVSLLAFLGRTNQGRSAEESASAYFSSSGKIVTNRGPAETAKIVVAKVFKRGARTLYNVAKRSKEEARWHLRANFSREFQHNVLRHVLGVDSEIADGLIFLLEDEEKLVRMAGKKRPFVRDYDSEFVKHLAASMKTQGAVEKKKDAAAIQTAIAFEQERIKSEDQVRALVEFLRGDDDWLAEQGETRLVWALRLIAAGDRKMRSAITHGSESKRRGG